MPAGQPTIIESAIGAGALSDDDLAATSVLTLTVPAGTFTETVDLLASAQAILPLHLVRLPRWHSK